MKKNWRMPIIFILLASILLLPGCWNRTELNDLAIITATALDLTEDKQLLLSVLLFVAKISSGGEQGAQGSENEETIVVSAKGKTIAEATAKLQEVLPRQVFWGHNKIYIFSRKVAKEGILDHIDFLLRHPGPRERAKLFVSQDEAREILKLPSSLEGDISEVLKELAKEETGLNVTLKNFQEMLTHPAEAAILPVIEIYNLNENKRGPILYGAAVFQNGAMTGVIDRKATRGVMWLRDEIKTATVSISMKGIEGSVAFFLKKNRTRLIPHIEGDKWNITVKIDTEDDIVQNTTPLNVVDPKHTPILEKSLGDYIEQRIRSALALAQKKWNADIFGFSDVFRRSYPKEWRKAKEHWDEIFPNIEVKVEPKVKVLRPGMMGK